jgi:hypothetical protein
MDILCVGMYRACSTWQYDVAAHLVEQYYRGTRLGFVQSHEYARLPHARTGAWRVLKSHEGGPAFAHALCSGRALALYAIRDPRDVVCSMLHKRQQDFDTFLRQGMVHQILANDRFWTRQPKPAVLCQRYEALIAKPAAGVREIADHLRIALPQGAEHAIADQFSFEANKKRTEDAAHRLKVLGVDTAVPESAVYFDPHSLLHWNHLREGRVGAWAAQTTRREQAILSLILGQWMTAHNYADRPDLEELLLLNFADHLHIARGAWACRMRCLSARFPRTSSIAKRLLGVRSRNEARPITPPAPPAPKQGQAA